MEIGPLLYFVTVAEQQSFTRAAKLLHVSQPTVSKLVRNLEEELGVPLLDRTGRQVTLTDAGAAVLAQARQILQSVSALSADLSEVMKLEKGTLRIGIPPMVGAPFFAGVMAAYHARYPKVALHVHEDGAQRVEEAVSAGDIDLGVILQPVDPERFDGFSLSRQPMLVVLHPTHRLAGQSGIDLASLRDEPFILFKRDFGLHRRIREACAQAGFEPHVVCESSQWDFIGEMVAADLGLAILPQPVACRLDPARLRLVPLEPPVISWDLALVWPKGRYLSFAARAWVETARAHLPQA